MKKIIIIVYVFILAICIIPLRITGQTSDCYNNYEKGVIFYNSGMSDSTLATLKPCLNSNAALSKVPRETRSRIYRLAAMSSIMLGDGAKAEEYIRQMLINQPDYKANPNKDDLMEFKQILDKIEVKPSFIAGIMAGTNYPFVNLEKQYSNYSLTDGKYSFKTGLGFQFEAFAEKALTKNISIEAAVGFLSNSFTYEIAGKDPSANLDVLLQYDQKVTSLNIPISAKHYFGKKSFRPYIEAGISVRFLLNQMEKSDEYGNYWFTNSSNTDKILTTFNSDLNFAGILVGGGAILDIGKTSVKIEARYDHYLNNSSAVSNFTSVSGYDDIPSSEKFHYTDDINMINVKTIQISIGLVYSIKYKVF
jgi:hypothetical protein